jgi:hypothetical protein
MNSRPASESRQRFDLTEAATLTDGYSRFKRRLSIVMSILLIGLGVFGIVLLWVDPKRALISWVAPLIVAVGGFATAAFVWHFSPRRSPHTLVMEPDAFFLQDIPDSKPRTYRWDDPELKITLFDLRSLPKIWPDGSPRPSDFVLQVRGAPDAQIPAEASELFLGQAHARGLRLSRRQEGVAWSPTPILKLTIRAKSS